MSFGKESLDRAIYMMKQELNEPVEQVQGWPASLPRTEQERATLLAEAQNIVAENKGKYLATDIAEFERLLGKFYSRTPAAQLSDLRTEAGVTKIAPVLSMRPSERTWNLELKKDTDVFYPNGTVFGTVKKGEALIINNPEEAYLINNGEHLAVRLNGSSEILYVKKSEIQSIAPELFNKAPLEVHSLRDDPNIEKLSKTLIPLTPDSLEQGVNLMNSVLTLLPESPYKNTVRNIYASVIFDSFRANGHNLMLSNNQIQVMPKPGVDTVNLQEKLQTIVNTGRLPLSNLQIGLLYSSPLFEEYIKMKRTKDQNGKILTDQNASYQDFIQYMNDRRRAGDSSPDIESIRKSGNMLSGVNFQEAIRGYVDMGQMRRAHDANQQVMAEAERRLQDLIPKANSPILTPPPRIDSPILSSLPPEPAKPNNRLSGQMLRQAEGKSGGQVTNIMKESWDGLIGGIKDILAMGNGDPALQAVLGIGLIYGIFKSFQKFGFLKTLAGGFAIGGLNNIQNIAGKDNLKKADEKIGQAQQEILATTKGATAAAAGATGAPSTAEKPAESTFDRSKLNDFQKAGIKSIESNTSLLEDIKNHAANNKNQNASLATYLEVLHKDSIQNITLDKIIYTHHQDVSIFSEKSESNFGNNADIPDNVSRRLLKQVIRSYIGINGPLSPKNGGQIEGNQTWQDFIAKYPKDAWKNKTLKDLINEIYKK